MKGIKKGLVCGSMVMGLMLAGACTEEDLDKRTSGYVEIALNWDKGFNADANASVDESGKTVPDGAQFFFYPVDGGEALVYGSDAPEIVSDSKDGFNGFRGRLPAGSYHLVVMNRNHTNTELQNENSYESARLVVKDAANAAAVAAARAAADAPLIGQPASVFLSHGFDGGNEVLEVKASRDEKVIASTSPKSMVKRVRFTITVENFTVHACHCVFGGIARAIQCSTCQCIQEPARVMFDASCNSDDPDCFTATFNVFDLVEPGVKTHPLELTLELDEGTKTTTLDLSDSVEKGLEGSGDFSYEIPLDLEIKLTENIDGSIHATVEEWAGGGSGSGVGGYDKN